MALKKMKQQKMNVMLRIYHILVDKTYEMKYKMIFATNCWLFVSVHLQFVHKIDITSVELKTKHFMFSNHIKIY